MIYVKKWHSGELSVVHSSGQQLSLLPESSAACCSASRSVVKSLSGRSRTRLRRYLQNTKHQYPVMVTLTYGPVHPQSGKVAKLHLKRFRQLLINHHLAPESACWFLEFQERGAPHFHILLTGFIPYQAVAWLWHWSSGAPMETSTNVKKLTKPVQYAVKYAKKATQKEVPDQFKDVGSFWGVLFVHEVHLVEATTIDLDCDKEEIRALKGMENAEMVRGRKVLPGIKGFLSFNHA